MVDSLSLADIGFLLVILGIIVIVIGFVKLGRGGRGGGILLIGPIPIIWGSDKESLKWVMLVGIVFIILYFLFILYFVGGG